MKAQVTISFAAAIILLCSCAPYSYHDPYAQQRLTIAQVTAHNARISSIRPQYSSASTRYARPPYPTGYPAYHPRFNLGGGTTIEHDLDPLKSFTMRPRVGGGATIENDFNPLETYTMRPRAGGGATIENDFTLDTIDVDER